VATPRINIVKSFWRLSGRQACLLRGAAASTLDDARAIARAAKGVYKQNFQVGLLFRSDPPPPASLAIHVAPAPSANGQNAGPMAQKAGLRLPSPNPDREKEINWRLAQRNVPGLIGRTRHTSRWTWAIGYLHSRPMSVNRFWGDRVLNDGRDVPIPSSVFQYPAEFISVTNVPWPTPSMRITKCFTALKQMPSMWRGNKAWMFKEVDAPSWWEVYAPQGSPFSRKPASPVANAPNRHPREPIPARTPPIPARRCITPWKRSSPTPAIPPPRWKISRGNFGDNAKGLKDYLAGLSKGRQPAAGYQEGYELAVTVIKANESILKGQKVTFQKEWFEIDSVSQAQTGEYCLTLRCLLLGMVAVFDDSTD